MKKKRILAYLIDIIIVISLISIIHILLLSNQVILTDLNEQLIQHEITFSEYFNEYSIINYEVTKNNFLFNLLTLIITIIYFVIIPYFNKGSTIGKKIFGIKIIKKDNTNLELSDIVERSVLIDGIGYLLFMLIFIWITPYKIYFFIENILGIMQIIVVIISGFMVLYRKDNLGLHDILTKTYVG